MANVFQTSSVAVPKPAPSDFAAGIREGIIAAILAFGLFVLIVGFKTEQNINNELVLVQRWGLLFILVALSGVGRFLHRAFLVPYMARRAKAEKHVTASGDVSFFRKNFSKLAILFLFIYPVLIVATLGFQGSLK